VMIWYMPIGFINSVTQYVLIALDQQRFITRAFAIALAFNIVANVVLITQWGYQAAAYVAIASELALLIPFYIGIRRHLTTVPWLRLLYKPWAAALPLLALWTVRGAALRLALTLPALAVSAFLVYRLHVFDPVEAAAIGQVLPLKRAFGRLWAGLKRRLGSVD
ncbi:MAG: polysaccharide biosynthesis C-terminal domain-containing protein, partial [Anaerolineales bacterium]